MNAANVSRPESEIAGNIVHEHEALREKVHGIHCVLAEHNPNTGEIETLLREFLNALVIHFSHEEEEGFFQEIAAKTPHNVPRADKLCVEHRELLHEADALCRFAEAGSPSMQWWRELSSRCHEFSRRLMQHECEETRLLQEAQLVNGHSNN